MKKVLSATLALAMLLTLVACGDGESGTTDTTQEATTAEATSEETTPAAERPDAMALNEVLGTATDPNASIEDRTATVQGGDSVDPALFDTLIASQEESGAEFQVVDPILPGYTPDSVLATVNFTLPEREPQVAENVEFIYEDDAWKLSQSWACTLVTNTVPPEQVPGMCQDPGAAAEADVDVPDEQAPEAPAGAEDPAAPAAEEVPAQ